MRSTTLFKLSSVSIMFCALLLVKASSVNAQTHQDSVIKELISLRNDYITKIKAMGYAPSLKAPEILLGNPPSYGNYDDEHNVLDMADWTTLPAEDKAPFTGFAQMLTNGMTAEKFFSVAVYKWIFVHELGHWWRTCEKQKVAFYEEEKGANRLASAYWKAQDPDFYKLMLVVFQGVVDHMPSPVPKGENKEKYLMIITRSYRVVPLIAGTNLS